MIIQVFMSNDVNALEVLNLIISTISAIGTILVPIGLACWGYKKFWPDFKKQKRIENLSLNAKNMLEKVTKLEILTWGLFFQLKKQIKNPSGHYDNIFVELYPPIYAVLCEIKNGLQLLIKDENLIKNKKIGKIKYWIATLEKIITHKYPIKSFGAIDFLTMLEINLNDDPFDFQALEKLRTILLDIYQMDSK